MRHVLRDFFQVGGLKSLCWKSLSTAVSRRRCAGRNLRGSLGSAKSLSPGQLADREHPVAEAIETILLEAGGLEERVAGHAGTLRVRVVESAEGLDECVLEILSDRGVYEQAAGESDDCAGLL